MVTATGVAVRAAATATATVRADMANAIDDCYMIWESAMPDYVGSEDGDGPLIPHYIDGLV